MVLPTSSQIPYELLALVFLLLRRVFPRGLKIIRDDLVSFKLLIPFVSENKDRSDLPHREIFCLELLIHAALDPNCVIVLGLWLHGFTLCFTSNNFSDLIISRIRATLTEK